MKDRWKIPLRDFYKNRGQNGIPFQMMVLKWFKWLNDNVLYVPQPTTNGRGKKQQRGPAYQNKQSPQQLATIIIELSPWSGYHIFQRNLHANRLLSTKEFRLYDVATIWHWEPDVTLYLHTP